MKRRLLPSIGDKSGLEPLNGHYRSHVDITSGGLKHQEDVRGIRSLMDQVAKLTGQTQIHATFNPKAVLRKLEKSPSPNSLRN